MSKIFKKKHSYFDPRDKNAKLERTTILTNDNISVNNVTKIYRKYFILRSVKTTHSIFSFKLYKGKYTVQVVGKPNFLKYRLKLLNVLNCGCLLVTLDAV